MKVLYLPFFSFLLISSQHTESQEVLLRIFKYSREQFYMAKKSSSSNSVSLLIKLLAILLVASGTYFLYMHQRAWLHEFISQADAEESITCFEATIIPEDLQKKSAKTLLKNEKYSWGESHFIYLPCLLVDAKYSQEQQRSTQSGKMLWDLSAGELILDTNTFAKTAGFEDCLSSKVNAEDFRILNLLAKHQGSVSKDIVLRELGYDDDLAFQRIQDLRKKKLIATSNDTLRIHVENPLFRVEPKSNITLPFVTREVLRGQLIPTRFNQHELIDMIKVAFGSDLGIRSTKIVFLPIIQLKILNPDGSKRTTHWNAITGKEIIHL